MASTTTISLSENGNDSRPITIGSAQLGPYRSFARVHAALTAVLGQQSHRPTHLMIVIGPGTYFIETPLHLDGTQLGQISVEIKGAGADKTRVLGSITVGDASKQLWSALLDREALDRFQSYSYAFYTPVLPHPLLLWQNDERRIPGRWPQNGWGFILGAKLNNNTWEIRIADASNKSPDLSTGPVRLEGFLGNDWAYESVPATIIGPNMLTVPANRVRYGIHVDQRVRLENAKGTDVDDSLYVDMARKRLIGTGAGSYELARTESFAQIFAARHITIRGLALSGFAGDAISIEHSSDVAVLENLFEHIGNRGVFADSSSRVLVSYNTMRFMGEGGVDANGGDRVTLEHSGIVIDHNKFDHFSEVVPTYRPAVRITGVGISVLDNSIRDAPHIAVLFEGNEHLIKGNDISNVAQETRDSGAIYTWRDWATYGTVIEDNLISHIRTSRALRPNGKVVQTNSVRGIYLDDYTSGISIKNNIFVDVDYAIFVNGGSDVDAQSNIFVRCDPPFALNPWGVSQPDSTFTKANRAVAIIEDLRASHSKVFDRYPRLRETISQLRIPSGDLFQDNLVIDSAAPTLLGNVKSYVDLSNQTGATLSDLNIPDPATLTNPRTAIRAIVARALKDAHLHK